MLPRTPEELELLRTNIVSSYGETDLLGREIAHGTGMSQIESILWKGPRSLTPANLGLNVVFREHDHVAGSFAQRYCPNGDYYLPGDRGVVLTGYMNPNPEIHYRVARIQLSGYFGVEINAEKGIFPQNWKFYPEVREFIKQHSDIQDMRIKHSSLPFCDIERFLVIGESAREAVFWTGWRPALDNWRIRKLTHTTYSATVSQSPTVQEALLHFYSDWVFATKTPIRNPALISERQWIGQQFPVSSRDYIAFHPPTLAYFKHNSSDHFAAVDYSAVKAKLVYSPSMGSKVLQGHQPSLQITYRSPPRIAYQPQLQIEYHPPLQITYKPRSLIAYQPPLQIVNQPVPRVHVVLDPPRSSRGLVPLAKTVRPTNVITIEGTATRANTQSIIKHRGHLKTHLLLHLIDPALHVFIEAAQQSQENYLRQAVAGVITELPMTIPNMLLGPVVPMLIRSGVTPEQVEEKLNEIEKRRDNIRRPLADTDCISIEDSLRLTAMLMKIGAPLVKKCEEISHSLKKIMPDLFYKPLSESTVTEQKIIKELNFVMGNCVRNAKHALHSFSSSVATPTKKSNIQSLKPENIASMSTQDIMQFYQASIEQIALTYFQERLQGNSTFDFNLNNPTSFGSAHYFEMNKRGRRSDQNQNKGKQNSFSSPLPALEEDHQHLDQHDMQLATGIDYMLHMFNQVNPRPKQLQAVPQVLPPSQKTDFGQLTFLGNHNGQMQFTLTNMTPTTAAEMHAFLTEINKGNPELEIKTTFDLKSNTDASSVQSNTISPTSNTDIKSTHYHQPTPPRSSSDKDKKQPFISDVQFVPVAGGSIGLMATLYGKGILVIAPLKEGGWFLSIGAKFGPGFWTGLGTAAGVGAIVSGVLVTCQLIYNHHLKHVQHKVLHNLKHSNRDLAFISNQMNNLFQRFNIDHHQDRSSLSDDIKRLKLRIHSKMSKAKDRQSYASDHMQKSAAKNQRKIRSQYRKDLLQLQCAVQSLEQDDAYKQFILVHENSSTGTLAEQAKQLITKLESNDERTKLQGLVDSGFKLYEHLDGQGRNKNHHKLSVDEAKRVMDGNGMIEAQKETVVLFDIKGHITQNKKKAYEAKPTKEKNYLSLKEYNNIKSELQALHTLIFASTLDLSGQGNTVEVMTFLAGIHNTDSKGNKIELLNFDKLSALLQQIIKNEDQSYSFWLKELTNIKDGKISYTAEEKSLYQSAASHYLITHAIQHILQNQSAEGKHIIAQSSELLPENKATFDLYLTKINELEPHLKGKNAAFWIDRTKSIEDLPKDQRTAAHGLDLQISKGKMFNIVMNHGRRGELTQITDCMNDLKNKLPQYTTLADAVQKTIAELGTAYRNFDFCLTRIKAIGAKTKEERADFAVAIEEIIVESTVENTILTQFIQQKFEAGEKSCEKYAATAPEKTNRVEGYKTAIPELKQLANQGNAVFLKKLGELNSIQPDQRTSKEEIEKDALNSWVIGNVFKLVVNGHRKAAKKDLTDLKEKSSEQEKSIDILLDKITELDARYEKFDFCVERAALLSEKPIDAHNIGDDLEEAKINHKIENVIMAKALDGKFKESDSICDEVTSKVPKKKGDMLTLKSALSELEKFHQAKNSVLFSNLEKLLTEKKENSDRKMEIQETGYNFWITQNIFNLISTGKDSDALRDLDRLKKNYPNKKIFDGMIKAIHFAQQNAKQETNFWLERYGSQCKNRLVADENTESPPDSEQREIAHVEEMLSMRANYFIASNRAKLGYHREAAEHIKSMYEKDKSKVELLEPKSDYSRAHKEQSLNLLVGSLAQRALTNFIHGNAPILSPGLELLNIVQIVVPNLVPLTLQASKKYIQNKKMGSVVKNWGNIKAQLYEDVRHPFNSEINFNGAMMLFQGTLKVLQFFPVESSLKIFEYFTSLEFWKDLPLYKSVKANEYLYSIEEKRKKALSYGHWFSQHVTTPLSLYQQIRSAAKVGKELGNGSFSGASVPQLCASAFNFAIDFGFEKQNTYLASRGQAIEERSVYQGKNAITSILSVVGLMFVARRISGNWLSSLPMLTALTSSLYGIYNLFSKAENDDSTGQVLQSAISNIAYHHQLQSQLIQYQFNMSDGKKKNEAVAPTGPIISNYTGKCDYRLIKGKPTASHLESLKSGQVICFAKEVDQNIPSFIIYF